MVLIAMKATISPKMNTHKQKVSNHPFFGMQKQGDVEEKMHELRGGRYRASLIQIFLFEDRDIK